MSLAKQIAARMLARKSTAAAPAPRVVSPPVRHTSPPAYNPPKVPRAERRVRQSLGAVFRNAPEPEKFVAGPVHPGKWQLSNPDNSGPPIVAAPVRTSALPVAPAGPRTITERPPTLPPVPPRAELDVDLVRGLQAVPLPAAPPANSAPAPAARGRGSCKAIDAATGRQCRLPAHPEDPERHRNERGPFFRVLEPGQVPRLHQQLDAAAMASTEAREVFAGHGHASTGERKTRKDAGQRKSAHAGDSTSTGIKSIDTTPDPEASP